jgi:hypothetical protein
MDTPSGSPIIYQSSPTFASNALKETWKDKLKKHLPKIIFAVLALFLVGELIYGIQTLTRPFPTKVDATSTIGVGKIVLDAPQSNFAQGEQIPVKVRVVTAGRATDSTDLLLKYDPKILDATSSGIINGTLYKEYIINEVDQGKGEVRISAITPPNTEGFVGVGEFATVNFLAKQDGNTKVEVDFVKGSTTDSNLVETGIAIDILDEVYNLDLKIGSGETATSPAIESCGGYYQYCHNLVGQTGRQFCRQGRKIENMCTFDPKLTTECDICRLGF